VLALVGQWLEHLGEKAVTPDVALPWVLPFGLLLACIAIMPFAARHFWEKYFPHVAIGFAAVVAAYYLFVLQVPGGGPGFFESHAGRSMARSFGDYISFIFLLGSLFTVSGGILIHVRRKATPGVNTLLLLAGAVLANVFGTTGAAMLLIRPYLRINKGHIRPFHIIFFIFIVANVGGSLTPIGDPPLFLGFLRGVPFWWVLDHCWPMWCVAVAALLAAFYVMDTVAQRKEKRAAHDPADRGPAVSLLGVGNLLLVLGILAGVLLQDEFNAWWQSLQAPHFERLPLREWVMTAAITISLWRTSRRIHTENVFNFAPIREVALLFIGIFATMVPALNYLAYHAQDPALERVLHTSGQFYYSSGTLSSVLDNAPTYVTFLEAVLEKPDKEEVAFIQQVVKNPNKARPAPEDFAVFEAAHAERFARPGEREEFERAMNDICDILVKYHGESVKAGTLREDQVKIGMLLGESRLNWYLVAISLGAVFFGAMTYIGNGPNFMVKSIAENAGVKCPFFFGYIGCYSLPILLPVLILIWAIFLLGHG
jgi:Na+/H+ antiporter NhaD/arsenite permease-like protein